MRKDLPNEQIVDAPIVAVTVYPRHARITRAATVTLEELRLVVSGLPLGLQRDSVRVKGSGPATITGVEVLGEVHARLGGDTIRALLERRDAARALLDELRDAGAAQDLRADLLRTTARRSGAALAKAFATGRAEPGQAELIGSALTDQLTEVLASRRELTRREERAAEDLSSIERELEIRRVPGTPDRIGVTIDLAGEPGSEVHIELSYVVPEASWEPGYDLRLSGEEVAVTWQGMITQHTGEDWPACELSLSTARPAIATEVPEPGPWYLYRIGPPASFGGPVAPGGGGAGSAARELSTAAPMPSALPEAEHGVTATTYRPARPIAVPSGGDAHRLTLAELTFPATLEHVAVPAGDEQAYLRAVLTNTGEHTLLPGKAALFHESEFVGTTSLPVLAPGEETELALGVDDRVRVRRELLRQDVRKGPFSATRKREAGYRITVRNHGARRTSVRVLDQVPVSRDADIVVRDVRTEPEPAERDDLGLLTWRIELEPGARKEITFGFRVDVGKDVNLGGWRE